MNNTLEDEERDWYWSYYTRARRLYGRVADKYLMHRYNLTVGILTFEPPSAESKEYYDMWNRLL